MNGIRVIGFTFLGSWDLSLATDVDQFCGASGSGRWFSIAWAVARALSAAFWWGSASSGRSDSMSRRATFCFLAAKVRRSLMRSSWAAVRAGLGGGGASPVRWRVARVLKVSMPLADPGYFPGLGNSVHYVSPGGLTGIAEVNTRKAGKLYAEIDRSGFYRGTANKEDRSLMNVTFRLPSVELEERFAKEAKAAGLDGLKGHRSVGGLRASIYNAVPEEGVDALVSFMQEFEKKNG